MTDLYFIFDPLSIVSQHKLPRKETLPETYDLQEWIFRTDLLSDNTFHRYCLVRATPLFWFLTPRRIFRILRDFLSFQILQHFLNLINVLVIHWFTTGIHFNKSFINSTGIGVFEKTIGYWMI